MQKFLVTALLAGMAGTVGAALPPKPNAAIGVAVSADGMRIAYETRGAGNTAVVLVHGWSTDRTYFRNQLAPLAQKYFVVAIDLAGHGASSLGRKNSTIASFGEDIAAVVNKLALKRMVLVGHSMGGDAVVAAARVLKGRVLGLIWLDDYRDLRPPDSDADIERYVGKFRANFPQMTDEMARSLFRSNADPKLVDRVARDMASAPPLVGTTSLESSLKYARQIPGALAELKLPVIAINADNGPTDRVSLAKRGVKVRVMLGVGHFLMLEAPEKFEVVLESTIRELDR